jgi:putative inorganic carbon (hco3(-)) transporter
VQFVRTNRWLLLVGALFIALSSYFIWKNQLYMLAFPVVLLAIYSAVFNTQFTFLLLFLLTPLSVNIEEYVNGFGLFVPTEPLLFGLMLLLLFQQIKYKVFPDFIWKNAIVWAIGLYLLWVLFTSITSDLPLVSFKFLLARLWFMIPMLFYGSRVFLSEKNIKTFLWFFTIGMTIAMVYTVFMHASYAFGEKESHWVMWPFFKDHTIYGAMTAFLVPLIFGIYFSKKHPPLIQAVLLVLIAINLIALFFSYTRAAWLSVIAAMFVWLLIHFKIKFSLILGVVATIGVFVFFSWTSIEQSMSKNKSEHTTEDFGKRLESAANVTTDASNLERINRWSCAIAMFQERPIVGFGPGTYAFEYARFQEPENLTIISTNFGDGGNAHSEYLGPLAEMGFLGLIVILILISAIFYKGITLYNRWPSEKREMKVLILAMILALVTYFVHGILNNYLDTDKAAVPIWGICACFIALEFKLNEGLLKKNEVVD